jgi:hypothetical protein
MTLALVYLPNRIILAIALFSVLVLIGLVGVVVSLYGRKRDR